MSMKKRRCSSMLSLGATLCLCCLGHGKKSAWLAWRSRPSAIDAVLDISLQLVDVSSETREGIERFLVVVYRRTCSASGVWKSCWHMVRGQWRTSHQPKRHCCNMCDARHSKRGMCGHRRLFRSLSCLVLHFGGGSHLIRRGNPFGPNYQRRPLHGTNVYTADARMAAGASANDVHRIYRAHNSTNVADHVTTTCSISSLFVHDAHYYYVVM